MYAIINVKYLSYYFVIELNLLQKSKVCFDQIN